MRAYKVTYLDEEKKSVTQEIKGIAAARLFARSKMHEGTLESFVNKNGTKITL